jgi:hypothetical protein
MVDIRHKTIVVVEINVLVDVGVTVVMGVAWT